MSQNGGQQGGPADPVGAISANKVGTAKVASTEGPAAATPTEAATAAGSIESAHGPEGVGSVGSVGETPQVASALQAGEIDATQAQAELIEQAIAAHLPAGADPALVQELRADLQAAFANDPTLAALLR